MARIPLIEADGDLLGAETRRRSIASAAAAAAFPGRSGSHCTAPSSPRCGIRFGETLRLKSSFPLRLSEFAIIIITARAWDCDLRFQRAREDRA